MKSWKEFKLTKKRALVLVIILAVILGVFFVARGRNKKDVVSTKVERGLVRQELILTGSVKAEKYVALSFPASGKIAWVGVTEGQKVVKGQALTKLDTTTLNATYQQALNTYKDKEAAAQKAEDDVKNHASDETFTQKSTRVTAQVARDNAWDSVLAAKYNLSNATLVAPFSGIISSLPFSSPGVNVSVTDTIVEVIDTGTIYFDVDADQSEVTEIKDGQEVVIVLDSYQEKEFKGKVTFIAYTPKAGESGTIYKVKVKFDEGVFGNDFPRVGMTGDAKFVLSQKDGVLFAPPRFVNSDKGGKYVNLGKKNKKVRVEVGIEGEDRIEIVSGVKEGDTLYD